MSVNDEKAADDARFRVFGVLLVVEALAATLLLTTIESAMPWWLPGLMVLTPPGWLLPWVGAYLIYRPAHTPDREQSAPRGEAKLYSRLPRDWANALVVGGFDLDGLYQAVDRRYALHAASTAPRREQLFRAFHLTPLDDVAVVMLGQDPYPRAALADGLAFSQPGNVEPNSSLARIFDNLESDGDLAFSRPARGDLTEWAGRGVLLLNQALTITDGVAGSDLRDWNSFTRRVLVTVNRHSRSTVFLCLGRPALDAATRAGTYSHQVVSTAHPMARDLEQSELVRFRTSRPFSTVNGVLREKGKPAIDWRL